MKNKKGSILVFALIILSFILLAAFSLSAVSLIERRSANISVNSSTAFQNSDKGMEEFLQQLYKEMDQLDTLNDLAGELGAEYECYGDNSTVAGTDGGPARIGSQDTEFIITAYKNRPPAPDQTEWEAVDAITDCSESIADVAKFRATGNHNNAARAVFLKLRSSLTRGLVAHWSFEDRAQNERIAVNDEGRNAVVAMNSSKYDYPLTLCGLYSSDEVDVNVGDITGDGNDDTYYVVEFDKCSYGNGTGMNPYKYDDSCTGDDEDTKCSTEGSWVPGVVQEGGVVSAGVGNSVTAHTEAIHFDGVADILIAFLEGSSDDPDSCHGAANNCDVTLNYIEAADSKRLDLDDGIAISAWFKRDDASSSSKQTIVSKKDGNDGYKLSVQDREICFYLGNDTTGVNYELCRSVDANYHAFDSADKWNYVIAVWRKSSSQMQLYFNGHEFGDDELFNSEIGTNDLPLAIGGNLDTGSISESFEGAIDDVRIWNRALTSREAERLCNDGAGEAAGETDERQGTTLDDGGIVPECAAVGSAAGEVGGGGAVVP